MPANSDKTTQFILDEPDGDIQNHSTVARTKSAPTITDPALVYHYTLAVADEENATGYRSGGFLCVQLNQDLHGRYHILRKLGRGSFATVWLAYDKRDCGWVSLKILRADQLPHSNELDCYTQIKKALRVDCLSSVKIVHLINHFQHRSIHGDTHQCLVFELLGPTIYSEFSQNVELGIYPEYEDAEEIFRMTIRVLQGMTALHQAGYAWGDPSPKNFAYTFPPTRHLNQQQVLDTIGPVTKTALERLDGQPLGRGVPACLITSATFPDWPIDEYEDDFRVLDLGSAFPLGERKKYHAQPTFMQPPERIFDHETGYETDSWGAGIMIYYFIFADSPPFSGHDEANRIQTMIDYIGPIPQRWNAKWEIMKQHLREGTRPRVTPGSILEDQFATAEHSRDVELLLPVIQGLMRLVPEARDSPKYALDSVVRICECSQDEELRELVPADYKYG